MPRLQMETTLAVPADGGRSPTDMTQLPQHTCVRLLADVAAELRPSIDGFADRDTLDNIDQSITQAKTAADGDLPRSSLEERSTNSNATDRQVGALLAGSVS